MKLVAWLDRSAYGEYKDASDIATVMYWYSTAPAVETYVYETERGQDLLVAEDLDSTAAAVRMLGEEIAGIVGATRVSEIAGRWPGMPGEILIRHMNVTNASDWSDDPRRRATLLYAMARGLGVG